jgi:hypothetical protein
MNKVLSEFIAASPDVAKAITDLDSDFTFADNMVTTQQTIIDQLRSQIDKSIPTVFDKLERTPWLVAAGTAANTNTTGNTATSAQTIPGLNYASRTIIPNGSYADKYWFKQLGANASFRRFRQEGSFLFPAATDSANSQCVETDFDKSDDVAGPVYNAGSQFDFAENSFRLWDRSTGVWHPTGIAMPRFAYATWVDFIMDFHHDNDAIYYDGYILNGNKLTFDPKAITFASPKLNKAPHINYGFQLDGEKIAKAYTVFIDNFKLTCWIG